MIINWLDLPKLTTLTTLTTDDEESNTFQCPRHVILESGFLVNGVMLRHAQSHQCGSSKRIRFLLEHSLFKKVLCDSIDY